MTTPKHVKAGIGSVRKLFLAGAILGLLGSSLLAAEGPTAQEILEQARLNQMAQHQEIKAQIRTGRGGPAGGGVTKL